MLQVARSGAPDLTWIQANLAALELDRQFDAVVMAGNVILFVAPGTEAEVVAGAARHVAPGGRRLQNRPSLIAARRLLSRLVTVFWLAR